MPFWEDKTKHYLHFWCLFRKEGVSSEKKFNSMTHIKIIKIKSYLPTFVEILWSKIRAFFGDTLYILRPNVRSVKTIINQVWKKNRMWVLLPCTFFALWKFNHFWKCELKKGSTSKPLNTFYFHISLMKSETRKYMLYRESSFFTRHVAFEHKCKVPSSSFVFEHPVNMVSAHNNVKSG